jgi:hypothetical protein
MKASEVLISRVHLSRTTEGNLLIKEIDGISVFTITAWNLWGLLANDLLTAHQTQTLLVRDGPAGSGGASSSSISLMLAA